ncbi:MAG: MCP four helix bundle domain-containing protein, partial [Alphaproteobacteria bacterium]|nr:MCP four helix bundle domain-containing protein [Alphaproteobacteria bacterium]
MNLKIGGRLVLGYSVMALVLAIAVGATLWSVSNIDKVTTRMVELRTPTAQASASIVNNINASLAALRGWMLTGNQTFKKDRAVAWADIAKVQGEMDALSQSWTNPANIEKWTKFKAILAEFKVAQAKVETISHSAGEQPATKMLVTEAAPRAAVMVKNISKMIDLELSGEGGTDGDRVEVLGMMADIRGSLGLGIANIRAYLLTGDSKFVESFKKLWAKNEKRFWDLSTASSFLSEEQKTAFDEFAAKRDEFKALPAKMFAIRGSEKWNMANFTLVTEAAPRAGKLLTTLLGPKAKDGSRSGGMVDNQRMLLVKDAKFSASQVSQLFITEWILLAVGLIIASIVVVVSIKSI